MPMLKKALIPRLFIAVLIAVAVVMFVGLPFAQFNLTSVLAQYGPSEASAESVCGGSVSFLVVLTGDTQAYADAALTQPAVFIRTGADVGKALQKFLACDNFTSATAWKIVISGQALYIPKGAGYPAPRNFVDPK